MILLTHFFRAFMTRIFVICQEKKKQKKTNDKIVSLRVAFQIAYQGLPNAQ
jgi:hypothetical protein